ncbi:MAG: alpha/beta fold hydrolase [Gaiellaceae bacterium]
MSLAFSRFTPAHRGGSGPPLVCLHGLLDTWRSWELVLPMLERRHDVLAPTLPGHAGGPPLAAPLDAGTGLLADAVEQAMDEAGFETAHLVGNSLGGHLAFVLAARGRAESVVAFAPAGGWAAGDESSAGLLELQRRLHEELAAVAPVVDALLATFAGRRRATQLVAERFEHIPPELIAHQLLGAARCDAVPMIEHAHGADWSLDAERITAPARIVWGTADRLLPWPSAAARYREDWLPQADWVVLDGVGHCPQLDVPLETAELILGFTGSQPARR